MRPRKQPPTNSVRIKPFTSAPSALTLPVNSHEAQVRSKTFTRTQRARYISSQFESRKCDALTVQLEPRRSSTQPAIPHPTACLFYRQINPTQVVSMRSTYTRENISLQKRGLMLQTHWRSPPKASARLIKQLGRARLVVSIQPTAVFLSRTTN